MARILAKNGTTRPLPKYERASRLKWTEGSLVSMYLLKFCRRLGQCLAHTMLGCPQLETDGRRSLLGPCPLLFTHEWWQTPSGHVLGLSNLGHRSSTSLESRGAMEGHCASGERKVVGTQPFQWAMTITPGMRLPRVGWYCLHATLYRVPRHRQSSYQKRVD